MGCCFSTPLPSDTSASEPTYNNGKNSSNGATKQYNTNNPAAAAGGGHKQQVRSNSTSNRPPRVESCEESIVCDIGNARIEYAYLSQRGYYPDEQNKLNQDAFSIAHDFTGVLGDAHFAVYDGHGRDGAKCAQFAKENMPAQMEKYIRLARAQHNKRAAGNSLPLEAYQNACTRAHLACNQAMHESNKVEDTLSGTTAISIAFHDKTKFTVCNVGDSRAIVGQEVRSGTSKNGETRALRALPLSRDQTPYRKDERVRVRKCGARILSLDQMEGLEPISDDWGDVNLGEEIDEGGDPPRVWSPNGEYPGTAFTRSLGDMIAEELGVCAEPEILSRDLVVQDKIIVVASDGVFEFLTNQSVIDMCAKFKDPLEACKAVVAEAYELWLQYECRTDDITMICMFVSALDTPSTITTEENSSWEIERTMSEGSRPVRTNMSKEKSKQLKQVLNEIKDDNEDEDFNINDLITEKTNDEKESIAEAIKTSVIFRDITDRQKELIFGVMESIPVRKGEWIIKQGEYGDRFYIVDSGKFEVRILNEESEDTDGSGGNLVHVYDGDGSTHPTFGELALMYSAPRAASIIAQTDGKLWALHRAVFKKIQAEKNDKQEVAKIVRKMFTRRGIRTDMSGKIVSLMREVIFANNEMIAKQGKEADGFYIVMEGTCEIAVEFGSSVDYSNISAGDYFGDKAFLHDGTFDHTVRAITTIRCMVIYRNDIMRALANVAPASPISSVGIAELKRYGAVHRDDFGVTILAKEGRNVYTLKVLSKDSVAESGEQRRVSDEVRLLKMMTKSICIPVVKETYQDRHFLYTLFEEALACNLESVIKDPRSTMDEDMAKHIAMCCLDALEIIHSKGVIYNGISSESLLVSHDGYILLNNFRFSKETNDTGGTISTIYGPAKYRSPEIVLNQGFGIASDFWALGVLIYECLTREVPFGAYTQYEDDVCDMIAQHQFDSIRLPPGASREGHTIVNKLLNPDPLDRLGGAGARSVKKDAWFSGLSVLSKHKDLSSSAKRHLKTALASKDATSNLPLYQDVDDPTLWRYFQS